MRVDGLRDEFKPERAVLPSSLNIEPAQSTTSQMLLVLRRWTVVSATWPMSLPLYGVGGI